jgi:hypothetical protein
MHEVSFAVMAHPSRASWARDLMRQIPGAVIHWDAGMSLWETARRAWLGADRHARWHVVVQDDAILCRDFPGSVSHALGHLEPVRPVSFYLGGPRPHAAIAGPALSRALAAGATWLEMEGPWWGVCYALPVDDIPSVVGWGDTVQCTYRDERRVAWWYANRRVRCWYTVPSLVDHRDISANPSLLEGHYGSRSARCFIGAARSAASLSWDTSPIVEPAHVDYP